MIRIAFGVASCRDREFNHEDDKLIADRVLSTISQLSRFNQSQLEALPDQATITFRVSGKTALLTTYRETLTDQDRILIVVQAFLPTTKRANYFGFFKIGRMFADGLLISRSGEIENAPDKYVDVYR